MKRAVVLVVRDIQGRVLLLKRSAESRVFPGEYCLPGGKVDPKDSLYGKPVSWEKDDEACIRECIEETGIVPTMIKSTGITAVGNDKKYVVVVFESLLPVSESEVTREFPNREHSEFEFFELNNLPNKIGELTKQIVLQVMK